MNDFETIIYSTRHLPTTRYGWSQWLCIDIEEQLCSQKNVIKVRK